MYEFDGFGKRIEILRKSRGLTQEELATRLGITSQAVSKWENDASYPDISLLPAICTILGTTLDDLFGKVKDDSNDKDAETKFPATYNGMKLVLAFKDIACYSDKEVESTDETNVAFKDGSMAELANKRIVNKGKGEIKLFTFKNKNASNTTNIINTMNTPDENYDMPKTNARHIDYEFGKISDLDFNIRHCKFTAEKSNTDKTTVIIDGEPEFVQSIKTEYNGNKLSIKFESSIFDSFKFFKFINWQNNRIEVKLAYDETNDLNASIHGNGDASVNVDFRNSNIAIHGSGNMNLQTFSSAKMAIHGSGNINAKAIKNAETAIHGSGNIKIGECATVHTSIHGSGNVKIEKANESVSVAIHGSGNITIGDSEIKSCEFKIFGGGNIDASSVTTDKAKINTNGGGRITIGRVRHESTEQVNGGGKINILNRGE